MRLFLKILTHYDLTQNCSVQEVAWLIWLLSTYLVWMNVARFARHCCKMRLFLVIFTQCALSPGFLNVSKIMWKLTLLTNSWRGKVRARSLTKTSALHLQVLSSVLALLCLKMRKRPEFFFSCKAMVVYFGVNWGSQLFSVVSSTIRCVLLYSFSHHFRFCF